MKADSDVAEAAEAMSKHRIRHVVVVDDRNTPKGVVSMRDLVGERATLRAILRWWRLVQGLKLACEIRKRDLDLGSCRHILDLQYL